MKILLVHNSYQYRGGEDAVVAMEKKLLADYGNEVIEYHRNNDEIKNYSIFKKLALFSVTSWSKRSYEDVRGLCARQKPDVAHFHNTLPLVSPSAYYACRDKGVPIVQTLHNYRLICPGGLLLRDTNNCEECLSRGFKKAVQYKCYRNSRIQTLAVVRMITRHRRRGTWSDVIDRYIALSNFSKSKFVGGGGGGLPGEKIVVKPNFTSVSQKSVGKGNYAIYLGRLSEEKGPLTLLEAWRRVSGFNLKVIGDGPLADELKSKFADLKNILFTGYLDRAQAMQELAGCGFVVIPSICYENFPMAIVEAFACGLPVIASKLGGMAEIVEDGVTGLHFNPGDADDLAKKVNWMINNPDERKRMGERARRVYEEKYNPERNYEMLMEIYSQAINERR